MAKDDYFKVLYVILTELYETQKAGEKLDTKNISPDRLKINDSYWLDIVEDAVKEGEIEGILIGSSKTGRVVSNVADMRITRKGMQYLEENSMMKKTHEALKGLKDITPFI